MMPPCSGNHDRRVRIVAVMHVGDEVTAEELKTK